MTLTPPRTPTGIAAAILLGAIAIATGAQIGIPMVPVSTTLQTFMVVLVGLWGGPVIGGGAAALYLVLVLLGLPVLSLGGAQPWPQFFSYLPAGYVVGFVPAGAVAGWLGKAKDLQWLVAAGLAAHAAVFTFGLPPMVMALGVGTAIEKGLTPFLIGAVAKSVVPALLVWATVRREAGA